jgi:hypothetical protein
MRILQTRSLCHVCCLGISWQVQQPNALGNSSGRDGLAQVYLSLDAPEVELEQALQDRWPVPQVNTAMSMNNAGETDLSTSLVTTYSRCSVLTIRERAPSRSPVASYAYLERRTSESCQLATCICSRQQLSSDRRDQVTTQELTP